MTICVCHSDVRKDRRDASYPLHDIICVILTKGRIPEMLRTEVHDITSVISHVRKDRRDASSLLRDIYSATRPWKREKNKRIKEQRVM